MTPPRAFPGCVVSSRPIDPDSRSAFRAESAGRQKRAAVGKLFLLALVVVAAGAVAAWRYQVTRPEYRFARAKEAVAAGQWDRAERIAGELDTDGRTDEAALIRAEAKLRQGRFEEALTALQRVKVQGVLRRDAVALSGRCLLALGNLPEARRAFAFVLSEDPDHADAHRGMAAVAYDLGLLDRAVAHSEQVARLDPSDGRPHRLIGLIHKDLAQLDAAEAAYREALRRALPEDERRAVYLELGETLLLLARYSEAVKVLDDGAVAGTPKNAAWTAARAESLRGLNEPAEAMAEVDRGLAEHPEAGTLWRIRGQLALDAQKIADAVDALEKAVVLSPSDYRAYYLLGQAYTAAGRSADAERAFSRRDAIRADLALITGLTQEAMDKPGDAGVRDRIAEVCDRLGKPELARTWRAAAAACRAAASGAGR